MTDFANRFCTGQGHCHLHLFLGSDSADSLPRLTVGCQRIQISTSQQNTIRAQRNHAYDVQTVADPAVCQNGDIAFTASAIAGNARAEDSTPSNWRPPWLGTTMPSAPKRVRRRESIFRIEDPFDHHRTIPKFADHSRSFRKSTDRNYSPASRCSLQGRWVLPR